MDEVIKFVYKVMFNENPTYRMKINNGRLRWENGQGLPVFTCHKDKGFIFKYWNYERDKR